MNETPIKETNLGESSTRAQAVAALNEAFKTLAQLHQERVGPSETLTYAIRCALGQREIRNPEHTYARVRKAFTLPQDSYDTRCKAQGPGIGLVRACHELSRLKSQYRRWRREQGISDQQPLSEELIKKAVDEQAKGFLRWISVMDALDYGAQEITEALELLCEISDQFGPIYQDVTSLQFQLFG